MRFVLLCVRAIAFALYVGVMTQIMLLLLGLVHVQDQKWLARFLLKTAALIAILAPTPWIAMFLWYGRRRR